jgi:hypothetical protein
MKGERERPRAPGKRYAAFLDPSGGSKDSFCVAVAHAEGDVGVLDCAREIRPPFDPDAATREIADLLKSYGIMRATSDKYAGAWVVERFQKYGITVEQSAQPKSDLYLGLLPLINSKRCRLLDDERLLNQLAGLERTTGRNRDVVDHQKNSHDDVANVCAGVLVHMLGGLDEKQRRENAYTRAIMNNIGDPGAHWNTLLDRVRANNFGRVW